MTIFWGHMIFTNSIVIPSVWWLSSFFFYFQKNLYCKIFTIWQFSGVIWEIARNQISIHPNCIWRIVFFCQFLNYFCSLFAWNHKGGWSMFQVCSRFVLGLFSVCSRFVLGWFSWQSRFLPFTPICSQCVLRTLQECP